MYLTAVMAKATRLMIPVVLVSTSMLVSGQTAAPASQDRPLFMGRAVTIVPAEYEKDDGLSGSPFPKTPASVCVEPPPQRQCYTPPDRSESPKFPFGNNPGVIIVQLKKDTPALFFSAETGGVSGWEVHFALLRPGTGKELENLFVGGIFVSNQNQHAFWSAPAVSSQQIFVTAEDVWGPGEGHYGEHRYIISSYVARSWEEGDPVAYWLDDRYMTARKYDLDKDDVLSTEKSEILSRLMRAVGARK